MDLFLQKTYSKIIFVSTEFHISRRNLAKLGLAGILGGLVGNAPDGGKTP